MLIHPEGEQRTTAKQKDGSNTRLMESIPNHLIFAHLPFIWQSKPEDGLASTTQKV